MTKYRTLATAGTLISHHDEGCICTCYYWIYPRIYLTYLGVNRAALVYVTNE